VNGIIGFVVIVVSFFTLPVQYLRKSWSELSEVGERRVVSEQEDEQLPLLNWLLVAGRMVIAISAILVYVFLVLSAAFSESTSAFVLAILFGWLLSVGLIWLWGMMLELISLQIVLVQNTREIRNEVVEARRSTPA
jgi:hypothetical protein